MEALFFILADAAQVVDGKLYMLGGAWNRLLTDTLPQNRSCAVAVGLELAPFDVGQRHSLRLVLTGGGEEDERDLGQGEFELGFPANAPVEPPSRFTAAFPLMLKLEREGAFLVSLYVDGSVVAKATFGVVQQPR